MERVKLIFSTDFYSIHATHEECKYFLSDIRMIRDRMHKEGEHRFY